MTLLFIWIIINDTVYYYINFQTFKKHSKINWLYYLYELVLIIYYYINFQTFKKHPSMNWLYYLNYLLLIIYYYINFQKLAYY